MSVALRRLGLPRTLLARNIALLIVLVMLSQVCSLAVLLHYVQKPRVERTAAVFANYVITLDGLFEAAPDSARDALVARLNHGAQPPGADELETTSSLPHFYITYQREVFLDALRQHLPADMLVRWQTLGGSVCGSGFMRMTCPTGSRCQFLRMPVAQVSTRPSSSRSASPQRPRSPAI